MDDFVYTSNHTRSERGNRHLQISPSQKVNLYTMFVLLISLPLVIILGLFPTNFFSRAYLPITPPVTPPTVTEYPTPTPVLPSPTPILTQTPLPTALPTNIPDTPTPTESISVTNSPTSEPTFTITSTPTLTVIPPANTPPVITNSSLVFGTTRKMFTLEVVARDNNADQIRMSVGGLPPGISFGSCGFRILEGKTRTSEISCRLSGTPSQIGLFSATFTATDIWEAKTEKTIYFTILP